MGELKKGTGWNWEQVITCIKVGHNKDIIRTKNRLPQNQKRKGLSKKSQTIYKTAHGRGRKEDNRKRVIYSCGAQLSGIAGETTCMQASG